MGVRSACGCEDDREGDSLLLVGRMNSLVAGVSLVNVCGVD